MVLYKRESPHLVTLVGVHLTYLHNTKEFSVIIIDKEWTHFFISGMPIIGGVEVFGSIYQFLWMPWWRARMKEVEKNSLVGEGV